jgi:hypothetical protein
MDVNLMNSKTLCFLFVLAANYCFSQVVPNPHFSFEKLNWGDSLQRVQQFLAGKNLREMPKHDNPFAKKLENSKPFVYTDTIAGKQVGVLLVFSKSRETLESVQCTFLGFDPARRSNRTISNRC